MKSRSRLLAISLATACLAPCLAAGAAEGAAAPAWLPIAASGPTNLPPVQSEVQRVAVDAEGGTFTLTASSAAAIGIGSRASNFEFTEVKAESGEFKEGQVIEGECIPAGNTITEISGTEPNLVLGISPGGIASSCQPGQSLVAIGASEKTPPINFNAKASEVESALNSLAVINAGGGSVTVSGGPGDEGATSPYFVSFGGSLANSNQPSLSADSSLLSGGVNHTASASTVLNGGPGTTTISFYAQNVGGVPSSGTTTVSFTLPTGVTTAATAKNSVGGGWSCGPAGPGQSAVTCTTTTATQPGFSLQPIKAPVIVGAGAASGIVHVTVSGGGAVGTAEYDMPLVVSAVPAPPGIQSFTAGTYTENGAVDTRAGAHPYSASAGIFVNTVRGPTGKVIPAGEFRDIAVDTPPGFLGNPIATEQCPEFFEQKECNQKSIVATAQITLQAFTSQEARELSTVNDIEAPIGNPAKFRFVTGSNQVIINVAAALRSDEDYGLEAGSFNTPQIKPVFGSFFTFWGAPADHGHDSQRCKRFSLGVGLECAAGGENVAFLTNPVACGEEALSPPVAALSVNTWQNPGLFFLNNVTLKPVTECENLHFEADFTFEPSETKSDSPASFRTSLTVPSEGLTDPSKLTTPEIKKTVVQLPKGVVLNASGADGLEACSEQQIGLKNEIDPATGLPIPLAMPNPLRFNKEPNTCPEASKIGSGELKTALLSDPLHGALYLAAQGKGNPFGSLFAIYLVIEDPRHGIFIKLPGKVEPNPQDGQMQVTFENLPQLPFTRLDLNLKGGNRSALASPTTCGTYTTTAINTPWSAPESGPPTESSNGFEINQGPNGMPCAPTPAERPFDLGLTAGTESAAAGAHSPLSFRITRPDGSQELSTLDLGTAPGLVASLKGIPECAASNAQIEARTGRQEQANPSCPANSQIGRTLTGAGAGPTPFYTPGKLYLAGPYKTAPLSVVAITPAVAGPFDLGNVVVRTALFVNRQSAQVTAKTDPIPQILEGVPLRIKDVRVILDRDNFALNPTSCDASAITVHATGNSGAGAELSSRFQVGGCEALAFKPKFSAKVTGGTKRNDHPAFSATVSYPEGPGYANIKDVQVALPHSEFLDQSHINTVCTRAQAAANQCPAGSIYGYAEAETPLLDGKLTGPVFLKSSVHKLPDLAIALKGPESQPIEVEFAGRIDSVHGQIRNTIEGLPDVPVSKFVLKMKGGKKGLLVNSRDLCKGRPGRMTVNMVGQNNKRFDTRPKLGNDCGKAKKHKRHKRLNRLLGGW